MERHRNIELDIALKGGRGVPYILSKYFPKHDSSGFKVLWQNSVPILGHEVNQIQLAVSWSNQPVFRIKPSTMTDYEFGAFCLCTKNAYFYGITKTIMELLEKVVMEHPTEINQKHIAILADSIGNCGLSGCSIPETKNKNETKITVVSFRGRNKIKAVPKQWGIQEIATYLLNTGTLPTPGEAREITHFLEQFEDPSNISNKMDIER